MTTLPTLYSRNANGSVQQWTVNSGPVQEGHSPIYGAVTVEYGQVGGALQTTTEILKEGKNIGKKTETTPIEQAALKAKQLWDKKVKEGYLTDMSRAAAGETDLQGSQPMLAFDYDDKKKYVTWPGLGQPKLDGFRCTAEIKNGKSTLYSRTRKPIKSVPHINEQIDMLYAQMVAKMGDAIDAMNLPDMTLDGELYNHELKDDFSKLASLIKRDELHEDRFKVQYHIYDNMNAGDWVARNRPALEIIRDTNPEHLKIVKTVKVNNEAELLALFEEWVADGYEGAMYRSLGTEYGHEGDKDNRSVALLKVKKFEDYEFEIIGMEEGDGKIKGMAGTFILRNRLNPANERDSKLNISKWRDEFKSTIVRLRKAGIDNPSKESDYAETKEQFAARRVEYMNNIQNYVGKLVTVQFQGRSKYYGVPRFPVTLRLKEEI